MNKLAKSDGQLVQQLRRFRSNTSGMVGLALIVIMVTVSAGAPLLTSLNPAKMDTNAILQPPSLAHLFGRDDLGRDVFSRVLYGGRISILVGLSVTVFTGLMGTIFGLLSGYYPRVDNPIMRAMDIVMAFPPILLALGIVAVLGPQLINVIVALAVPYTPVTARVVRGMVLQLKEKEFIEAARSIGASNVRIMRLHLLPNALPELLVQQTYILALSILAEASLSFLGVGVPPDVPTLGGIISDASSELRYAPWLPMFPGVAISMLVLGFNLLGDGLRDVLDPRMKM
jgi:peptide/nickel transport system permease protein